MNDETYLRRTHGCLACAHGVVAGFRFWCGLGQCRETEQGEAVVVAARCPCWQGEGQWTSATSLTRETAPSVG
jgi:hypothetical protein